MAEVIPKAIFTITGDIEDFTRLDNLYKSLKRESDKLLASWVIDIKVEYSEKKGERPE